MRSVGSVPTYGVPQRVFRYVGFFGEEVLQVRKQRSCQSGRRGALAVAAGVDDRCHVDSLGG